MERSSNPTSRPLFWGGLLGATKLPPTTLWVIENQCPPLQLSIAWSMFSKCLIVKDKHRSFMKPALRIHRDLKCGVGPKHTKKACLRKSTSHMPATTNQPTDYSLYGPCSIYRGQTACRPLLKPYLKISSDPMQLVVWSDAMSSIEILSRGETHTKWWERWNLGSTESFA